jgi:outer membrane protein TolC
MALIAIAQIARAQEEAVSLTLRECIERALENNLDISIERINPQIQSANVLGAYGDFDPHLQLNVSRTHSETPLFVVQTNSAATETRATFVSPGLIGKLPTGTSYDFSYDATRQLTSPQFINQYRGVGSITLTQPLMRNLGFGANLKTLRIAKKNKQIAHYTLVTKITDTVNQVHKAYYDLIFVIENLKVQEESLDLAKALLAENKKRLEVGMMSPLDVTQAESGVASQEEAVIQAQQDIRTQANLLRRLISSDVTPLRHARLVPVDTPVVDPVSVNVDQSIKLSLSNRPEYLQQKQQIELNQIQLRFDRNQLFPQVDLKASYGQAGLGSTFEQAFDSAAGGTDFPQWTIGLVVDIPLGDFQARGNYRSSKLKIQQSILQLKNTEQSIIVDVDNAAALVQTNLKRIDATGAARRLAEETLNAERKKLQAGTSTSYTVLQHQRDLTDARSKEIRAIADYNESLADLYRAEGTLLQKNSVVVKPD